MKKKIFFLPLAALLIFTFTACSSPDSWQLDLSQGCGTRMKLLHLNASTEARRKRLRDFEALLENAQPLEKDSSLFAYYPDYLLEITHDGKKTTVVLDVNGEYLDFYYPEENESTIYRSAYTAADLRKLIHQYD